MTARGTLAAGTTMLAAWGAWIAAGWIVADIGLPFAVLLQQALLFILVLSVAERVLARFAPSGEFHG
ncbi:hypothetical protein [Roseomonas fluvialis]|uniref:Uncharacterized protein n=1 Tax=Roseomonas fluvialis TaxID=1750527 RepID=A0ABN6NYD5_9PROT|nr:hypothetical protein [Roseomonas fluvialis]BDG70512.1 hypothetical protein Rmf_04410 [Roseomonas fluvialis]